MRRLILVIALCWLGLPGAALAAQPALGGRTVAQLPASGFFKFFALAQVGEQIAPGTHDTYLVYGTPGQFSGQVFVLVQVGKDGQTIEGMLATIQRSFIDTPSTSTFARDFAKSFLLFAAPAAAQAGATTLAREIWTGSSPGVARFVNHAGSFERAAPEAPPQQSDAYRAYMGELPKASVALPGCSISLQNAVAPGKQPTLTIAVEPRQG